MSYQLPNGSAVAYAAMARVYSPDFLTLGGNGAGIISACDVVAGTAGGTLKLNAGSVYIAGGVVTVSAQDNIACAVNADATFDRWALLEITTAGAAALNLGTAVASPEPPTPTAGRIVSAAIYIPATATLVDALLTNANTKCKIIDKRVSISSYIDRQVFTAAGAGTWTKPASAVLVWGRLIGGGMGGGSGRRGAAASARYGGNGGGSGGVVDIELNPADLGSTETVTVGAGGAGGAAQTTNSTNGIVSSPGGDTTFGAHALAGGAKNVFGQGAAGGSASVGVAGDGAPSTQRVSKLDNVASATFTTPGGGQSFILGTAGLGTGGSGTFGITSGGGAAGGGIDAANATRAGGTGGASGDGVAGSAGGGSGTGTAGTAGTTPTRDHQFGPGAGGGGSGSGAASGTAGGTGGAGKRGSGGGGGGASTDGSNSGAGGVGGDGYAVIYTLCVLR